MITQLLWIALFFLIIFFIWRNWTYITGGAGYLGTPKRKIRIALEMAGLKKCEKFYDLGCGFGKVLREAEKTGAETTGIELDPLRWWISKNIAKRSRVLKQDMFKSNFTNDRIKEKLEKELKKGARVMSYCWKIKGWMPKEEKERIILYIKK